MSNISEHILEVRYQPNPKVLDNRGRWAEEISKHMGLTEWRITENRIDIYDKNEKNHIFVGFVNSGFVVDGSPTKNYFSDQTTKLFNFLKNLDDFGREIFINRLGVKIRFCNKYEGSFDELKNRYLQKYLNLSKEAQQILNAKLIDIGGNLNFADDLGNFNTLSGPMEKKQINQFFDRKKESELPDVGFYFEIDYWIKPQKLIKIDEINNKIKKFVDRSWERFEKISALVFEN